MSNVEDLGQVSFQWAKSNMPVFSFALKYVQEKDLGRNLFQEKRISVCLHVSKETSVLIDGLISLGAKITLVAANPLSSQDEIAAFMRSRGATVLAKSSESTQEYLSSIREAARVEPELIVDDGGELHVVYSLNGSNSCFGGTEQTTSGISRLRSLETADKLRYPLVPVNEARTKHIFDNKYGSGQSALDGLLRSTGLLVAGKTVVVAGYGWVGRGVASRARGVGARVLITEVDGIKALDAHLDGFEVLQMSSAASIGDIFLTCTGQIEVLREEHFGKMKDGAILANVGHFDREIDVTGLYRVAVQVEEARKNVAKISREDGKSLYLLCQGRVVNLVAAEGHPPEVMQLSFANQLFSLYYLIERKEELKASKRKVMGFPEEIDLLVTTFALSGFGLSIDQLTERQKRYSASYSFSP